VLAEKETFVHSIILIAVSLNKTYSSVNNCSTTAAHSFLFHI